MPTHERVGKPVAKPRSKPPNRSAEIVEFPTSSRARPVGGFGRLPKKLITRRGLSPEAIFLLAYRSRHANDVKNWGCSHGRMTRPANGLPAVRGGWSIGVFKKAVRELVEAGLLERWQGVSDSGERGRGYAVDRLTFDPPRAGYVAAEAELFDGSLLPKEIALFLHLKARGKYLALPWHLDQLMRATRPTVNKLLKVLANRGLVKNFGTTGNPEWGIATLKNPTFKTTTCKTTTLKKPAHTRRSLSSRKISVPTKISTCTKGVEHLPLPSKGSGTDLVIPPVAEAIADIVVTTAQGLAIDLGAADGGRSPPMVMDAPGTNALSQKARQAIEALGEDPDEFEARTLEQIAKAKVVGNFDRYAVGSAIREAQKKTDVSRRALVEAISGNQFQRQASYTEIANAQDIRPKRQDGKTPNGSALLDALKPVWRQPRLPAGPDTHFRQLVGQQRDDEDERGEP